MEQNLFLVMTENDQLYRKCSTHQTRWDTFPDTERTVQHCRAQKTLWVHVHRPTLHLQYGTLLLSPTLTRALAWKLKTNTSGLPHSDISGPFPHVLFVYWPPGRLITSHCGKINHKTHMQRSWNCKRAAEESAILAESNPIGPSVVKMSCIVPSLNSFQLWCERFLKPSRLSCKIQLPYPWHMKSEIYYNIPTTPLN